MYRNHQPTIAAWSRRSPENLATILQFCIISMRQKFFNVPALIEEAGQESAGVLFGFKMDAYRAVWDDREAIYWNCEDIFNAGGPDRDHYLLAYLSGLYGLNCAKAGFACQLVYGVSGCLDTVNISRLKLAPRFCANFGQLKTPRARLARAKLYNAMIARVGGTERLWDAWCAAMAHRYPERFSTPHAASQWHLVCLNLERTTL